MVTICGKERQIIKTVFNISLPHLLFVSPLRLSRHPQQELRAIRRFTILRQFSAELANRSRPLSAGFRAVTLRIVCPNVLPLHGPGAVFRKRAGKDAAGRIGTGISGLQTPVLSILSYSGISLPPPRGSFSRRRGDRGEGEKRQGAEFPLPPYYRIDFGGPFTNWKPAKKFFCGHTGSRASPQKNLQVASLC